MTDLPVNPNAIPRVAWRDVMLAVYEAVAKGANQI